MIIAFILFLMTVSRCSNDSCHYKIVFNDGDEMLHLNDSKVINDTSRLKTSIKVYRINTKENIVKLIFEHKKTFKTIMIDALSFFALLFTIILVCSITVFGIVTLVNFIKEKINNNIEDDYIEMGEV